MKLNFTGSCVMLFGESTPHSGKCKVVIDGREKECNLCQLGPNNTGRMWIPVAEELDAEVKHSLEIVPVFEGSAKPLELCIESLCVAGGTSIVWNPDK